MLGRCVERVGQASLVDKIVIAAPHYIDTNASLFIGDENDVLKRYHNCAKFFEPKVIVRITSDCPLVMAETIDSCIKMREKEDVDYCAAIEPFYPDGMDVEVFTMKALKKAHNEATAPDHREHVTPYLRTINFSQYYLNNWKHGYEKISVDTSEDLERVRAIWNGRQKPYF